MTLCRLADSSFSGLASSSSPTFWDSLSLQFASLSVRAVPEGRSRSLTGVFVGVVMKKLSRSKVALAAALVLPAVAFADPVTSVAQLWNSISFADVTAAVFGIGALVIGVDLAQLGYMKVRRLVKGAH
jgi:hypothetical protein